MFERFKGERDGSAFVQALRRRWWVVLLVAAIAAAGAYEFSARKQKQYQATSSLLFTSNQLDQLALGKQVSISNGDAGRQAATNLALLSLHSVARLVAAQLHISSGRVISDVVIGSDSTSDVVSVTVTDSSPAMAAGIANAYVTQYKAFRKQTDRAELTDAESLVNSQLAASAGQPTSSTYQRLLSEQQSLQLLGSLQTGNADVVQTATVPHSPSSPIPSRDAVIGLLLGLLVGLGLVVVLERGDRRIKTPEELEELYRVPVIGSVPESKSLRGAGASATSAAGREQEAFRMIYAQLRYVDLDREVRRVIVTSAESAEGKSTVALNLARAAGSIGDKRVLLIEADMRRPSLTRKLGLHELAGLAELLVDPHDVASGLRELVVSPEGAEDSGSLGFDVLLAGTLPENAADLLSSRRMTELLAITDERYDLVILDTPPIGLVSDPISLVHQVDGVIVVGRLGWSHRDRAPRLMKQLRGLNANILGVVINGVQQGLGYYYGYPPDADGPRRERGTLPRRSPSKTS